MYVQNKTMLEINGYRFGKLILKMVIDTNDHFNIKRLQEQKLTITGHHPKIKEQ